MNEKPKQEMCCYCTNEPVILGMCQSCYDERIRLAEVATKKMREIAGD